MNIAGWVKKCPKWLRVFNNIMGWTFIFNAGAADSRLKPGGKMTGPHLQ